MDIHPQKRGGLVPYLVKGVFEKRSHRQGNPCEYALQIKLSENKANVGSLKRHGEQHSLRRNSPERQKNLLNQKKYIFSKNF